MKSGIININKGQNMTSHDVVSIVRRAVGIKRVGHTGTLDPMAEGVLPVAVGNATKFIEYLDKDIKTYVAGVKLGIKTDTLDIWGEKLENTKVDCTGEELKEKLSGIIPRFIGEIQQIPPKFSAVKVNGRRLYDYARKSQDVEIPKRNVHVYKLEYISPDDMEYIASLTGIMPSSVGEVKNDFFLLIECSRGTYVRSLIRDIGSELGLSAVMSFLVRTASGEFQIDDGISAESIKNMDIGELYKCIFPIDEKISCMRSIVLDDIESRKFQNGGKVSMKKIKYLEGEKSIMKDRSFHNDYRVVYTDLYKVYRGKRQGDSSDFELSRISNVADMKSTGRFLGVGRIVQDRFLKGEKVVPIESEEYEIF